MKIETQAKFLTAESKPYSMDGNNGVSHRIRLNVDGEIYVCKSSADQVQQVQQYLGEEKDVVLKVNSRKENMSLELVSVA